MTGKKRISESELIINPNGSIYHLHLRPEDISDTIITVGDPGRVEAVSKHFDSIHHKAKYREFITHTGYLNNKRLTVLSTGMGTDNVDIVMNELDALVNIDFETRTVKDNITSLNLIRVGTSGSVSEEVPLDTVIISEVGIGMDGLLNFYELENTIQETVYLEAFSNHMKPYSLQIKPYIATGGETLLSKFDKLYKRGVTVTAPGFYAPQGRALRAKTESSNFIERIHSFRHKHFRITNLEMETAGIYGFGELLGHQCLSVNAILAHRIDHTFSKNPQKIVDKMIEDVLELVTS